MPFDIRPLFHALLALWAAVQDVTSFRGNPLEVPLQSFGIWTVIGIFFLAGLSEAYGTRAVTLFLNKVGRQPFVIVLLLTALTYVVGGVVWAAITDWVIERFYDGGVTLFAAVLVAVAVGSIPLLFAFLGAIPYLGPAILHLLQGLSLLLTTLAVTAGYKLPFWQAAVCCLAGWLIFQLLRRLTAWPTTLLSRWVLWLLTGRELSYKLQEIVPLVPLGLQGQHQGAGEGER